jgi:hypothetical protein
MNRLAAVARRDVLFCPVSLVCLAASVLAAAPGTAQPVIGSPNTVTAEPLISRPPVNPCFVPLFHGLQFADFTPKAFTYTPPAACPGPWAKVILTADFAVTAGRQFDRTAQIAIGHVNVYYGTTAEPSKTVSPNWHVERDLTDYSSLFRTAHPGDVNLGNLVNSTYTGVISGDATLLFYPLTRHQSAPRTADLVLPLSDAPGGAVILAKTSSSLAPTLPLPTNIESAYLDVVTQSQSSDEFWYTCVPDDVATELASCPGTAFREAQITVDGRPVGVAPVYPWIFTGGIDPLLWRPIPGVQALNFIPYRVDLTPFAGPLSDGHPHQVGLHVFNADNYFLVTGSLLLYLDRGSRQVTGAVRQNTLEAAPHPLVQKNLKTAADGSITGTISTSSTRSFTVAGYVDTSHGRVETRIAQTVAFLNSQRFVVSSAQSFQSIAQLTSITSGTETRQGDAAVFSERTLSYPLEANITVNLNPDGSGSQVTTIQQSFLSNQVVDGGVPLSQSKVTNFVGATDTLLFNASGAITGLKDQLSLQVYFTRGTGAACYSRSIYAKDGLLTTVVDRTDCKNRPGTGFSWHRRWF